MNDMSDIYKRCSTCKSPIEFGAEYYRCSVSTCNRTKLGLYFCSLPCWEAHVPEARHRDAWAEPVRAPGPTSVEESPMVRTAAAPRARIVHAGSPNQAADESGGEDDVLVVVSKLKRYVRHRSEMNTSDNVVAPLSDHLRVLCNEAIRNAAREGRKTVMDRDFVPLFRKFFD